MLTVAALAGAAVAVALVYWLLITTEGTYLGPRVVATLYDWTAKRYDDIKKVRFVDEVRCLSSPLIESLGSSLTPRLLDVATGTARLPAAVLSQPDFGGQIVGVDRSTKMLREAQRVTQDHGRRITYLREDAAHLSFMASTFDAVSCLEALEFMTDPREVVREMLRVLRPGGVLLISNRVSSDAWWFPGRLCGRGRPERYLREIGVERVETQPWQVHYDLIWARKAPD